jgi:hypothetical protein
MSRGRFIRFFDHDNDLWPGPFSVSRFFSILFVNEQTVVQGRFLGPDKEMAALRYLKEYSLPLFAATARRVDTIALPPHNNYFKPTRHKGRILASWRNIIF